MPKNMQALYSAWPFALEPSPWANSKAVPGPWKLGLVAPPLVAAYSVDLVNTVKDLTKQAAAAGLVSGDLQTYVAPSGSASTPEQEIAAIQNMVRSGVNAIFLDSLNPDADADAITAAGKAGVPIILMQESIDGSPYVINTYSDTVSGPSAGVMSLVNGKGNVVDLRGPAGNSLEKAFNDILVASVSRCPNAKIIASLQGDWSDAGAKTAFLQYFASHPGQKIDAVLQNGGTGAGIIEAFQQAGKKVPPMNLSVCSGGCASWWAANTSKYEAVGSAVNARSVGYTCFQIIMRVLSGRGLKLSGIPVKLTNITNDDVSAYATVGEGLTYSGEPTAPLDGWGGKPAYLDQFFSKPGSPFGK